MSWYVHAVEQTDGQWTCRHGCAVFDSHPQLDEALAHLREIADELGPGTQVFVHYRDGRTDTDASVLRGGQPSLTVTTVDE